MGTMKNILWIDDDINRMALMPYIDELEEGGFKVIKASNPDEFEKILSENQDFDCIIIDVIMPLGQSREYANERGRMQTGKILLQKLIDNRLLPSVKKVVFTMADNADVRQYCDDHSVPYLEKQEFLSGIFVEEIKKILLEKV